jgi:hypothetical protein
LTVARRLSVLVILLGLILGAALVLWPFHQHDTHTTYGNGSDLFDRTPNVTQYDYSCGLAVEAALKGGSVRNGINTGYFLDRLDADKGKVSSHAANDACHDPAVKRVQEGAVAGGAVVFAGIAGLVVFALGKRPQEITRQ